jgi:hypothetical protein
VVRLIPRSRTVRAGISPISYRAIQHWISRQLTRKYGAVNSFTNGTVQSFRKIFLPTRKTQLLFWWMCDILYCEVSISLFWCLVHRGIYKEEQLGPTFYEKCTRWRISAKADSDDWASWKLVSTLWSFLFGPMPPHVPYRLCGPPSWLWPNCNRLLRLGRPYGAVTLLRWCVMMMICVSVDYQERP